MSTSLSIIHILLSPIYTIYEINKFIFFNTIYIPLSLVFTICLYLPFIKIPIITPLIYFLELENFELFDDIQWVRNQIELFLLTTLHFLICSIYIGIGIGIISGLNLSTIQFIFSLSIPNEIGKEYTEMESIWQEKRKINKSDELKSSTMRDIINSVIIPEEEKDKMSALPSDKIKLKMLQKKQQRRKHELSLISEDVVIPDFEDDDGYSYLRNRNHVKPETAVNDENPIAHSSSVSQAGEILASVEPIQEVVLSNIPEEESTEEVEESMDEPSETNDENREFSNDEVQTITNDTSI